MRPASVRSESDHRYNDDHENLQRGERKLKISGPTNADVVQEGNETDDQDGDCFACSGEVLIGKDQEGERG